MRLSVGDVLGQLVREGLAVPGSDEVARSALAAEMADDMPWFLRAAVAFGAWLATLFALFSLFAVAGIREESTATAVGALLVGGGIVLRRGAATEFLRWAAVALCLAGLGMLVFGVGGLTDSAALAAVVCLAASAAIIWLCPDATLRFLCTLGATSALFVVLVDVKAPYPFDLGIALVVAAAAYAWRHHPGGRSDRLEDVLAPARYALVVALFAALLGRTLATSAHTHWSIDISRDVGPLGPLATLACTGALLALVWKVLDEHGASLSSPASFAVLGGTLALGGVTLDSPGVVAGVAALALAFDRRNRVLLGMAAVFLIVFGSFYYYSLHLTLLEKSGALAGSGLLLLGVRGKVARR